MSRQSDPHNSRPIDIHRYSEFPEAKEFIDSLWLVFTEHFPEHIQVRRGRKTTGNIKDQFRALMLDLYVCWLEDSETYLGIHLAKNAYQLDSRYNRLHISFKITTLAHQCNQLGWLDWLNFSYSGPGSKGNRTTRIRASDQLIHLFKKCGIQLDHFTFMPDRECILLTDKDPDPDATILRQEGKTLVRYMDTEHTIEMRDELMAYNQLLAQTHIDVASLHEPVVIRKVKRGPYAGRTQRIRIGQHNKFVRRIFSRGSWQAHGRSYGGFWQQISEALRKDIYINGEPTIEIDFKALHVSLIYALDLNEIWPYSKDPFTLSSQVSFAPDAATQRNWIKLLVLQSLNADCRSKAFGAFRDDADTGSLEKSLKDNQLGQLIDLFLDEHPKLEDFLFKDCGVKLMNHDSRLMAHIINLCTKKGLPILSVHDSCICRRIDFAEVRAFMTMASIREVGYDLFVEQDGLEVDRTKGYGSVLTETAIRKLPVTDPSEGFTGRFNSWLNRRE